MRDDELGRLRSAYDKIACVADERLRRRGMAELAQLIEEAERARWRFGALVLAKVVEPTE